MKNNKRNFIIIFIITAIILYFALKDDFLTKVKYLLSFDIKWIIIAFLLILSYWFLKGLVLYYCASKIKKDYTPKKGILLMVTTQFFHAITPFAAGGQPWQIYKLKKDGLTLGESTNVIIQDFIAYQIALVLLGGCAIISNYIIHIFPSDSLLKKLVTIGFIINTAVVIVLFVVAFSKKWNKKLIDGTITFLSKIKIVKDKEEKLKKSEKFIHNFHKSAIILFKDKFNMFRIISLNFIALIGQYLIPFTLFITPSNESSPIKTVVSISSISKTPIACNTPIAIGKSKKEPSFLVFAGAKFTVIFLLGNSIPEFLIADLTLCLASFTRISGRPYNIKTWKSSSNITLNFN